MSQTLQLSLHLYFRTIQAHMLQFDFIMINYSDVSHSYHTTALYSKNEEEEP